MHPLVHFLLFYAITNALFAFAVAWRYRLYIARRNRIEQAPENHYLRWRIPKDRKDLTLFQAFIGCYEFLWICTIVFHLFLIAIAVLTSASK